MPNTSHVEQHFTATGTVRDIVIGMPDGLTAPLALAAGLSGAVQTTNVVVAAGFAEIVAGSIAMRSGVYLAARTDYEHYTMHLTLPTITPSVAFVFTVNSRKAQERLRKTSAIALDCAPA